MDNQVNAEMEQTEKPSRETPAPPPKVAVDNLTRRLDHMVPDPD